jgi:hypothetical protein
VLDNVPALRLTGSIVPHGRYPEQPALPLFPRSQTSCHRRAPNRTSPGAAAERASVACLPGSQAGAERTDDDRTERCRSDRTGRSRKLLFLLRGTGGSNPSSSSAESANFQFRSRRIRGELVSTELIPCRDTNAVCDAPARCRIESTVAYNVRQPGTLLPEAGRRSFYSEVRPRRVAPSPSSVWRRAFRRALRCGQPACAGQWRRRHGSGERSCMQR